MSDERVSVVIVNWNSRDDLAACIASVEQQTEGDIEIVVVDNGSVDGSVEMVRARFPAVVLVETGENLGFAEGMNRGLAVAKHPWIFALNNDAVAEPTLIAEARRAVREGGPRLGMVQAQILFQAPHDARINSTGVLMYWNGVFIDRDYDAPRRPDEKAGEVFCASAGACLYRRAMLDEVRLSTGWFDQTYFMYFEDVDLGWRCRLAGWDALYVPTAVVRHKFHGSASRRGKRFVYAHCMRNRVRTLVKNASPRYLLRALPTMAKDAAKLAWWEGPAGVAGVARALLDGARQRKDIERLRTVEREDLERRWVR